MQEEEEHVAATDTTTTTNMASKDEHEAPRDEGGEAPEDEGGQATSVYRRGPAKLPAAPLAQNRPVIRPMVKK